MRIGAGRRRGCRRPATGKLKDREPEWAFLAQIPHTETKPEPRNGAVPCRFEVISNGSRWRLDSLAGAAGFEPLHQESCPIGPTAIVRREEWQQIVRRTLASACTTALFARHDSSEASGIQIPDAEVRILPPQPASPVSTVICRPASEFVTLLGQGKITKRLMIGMSIETHKTSPDFDQRKCSQAKGRIMQALDDIDCDVFIALVFPPCRTRHGSEPNTPGKSSSGQSCS
jgi:hypothetical protein